MNYLQGIRLSLFFDFFFFDFSMIPALKTVVWKDLPPLLARFLLLGV